ncbi:MAG: hypothetical protein ACR2OJ_11325 [Hyphomicrobiales bacterium]
MPRLFRFLLLNISVGVVASWLLLAGLLFADVWGLGGLVARSSDGILAIAMLAIGFAITFGSASVATAVLVMRYEHDDDQGTMLTYRLNTQEQHHATNMVRVKAHRR